MRKRDRNRQWSVVACEPFRTHMLEGDNRNRDTRLIEVNIGEWLKVGLIGCVNGKGKEQYRVQFGDETWVVSIMDNGDASINLSWAKSLVDANPVNISGGRSR